MNVQPRLIALVLLIPMLASCALLADRREEIVVYSLRPASTRTQADTATRRAWQLALPEPQAMAPLDGTRIVVMPQPVEIRFYRGARWRDAVPAMLQAALLQVHENRVNVAAPGSGNRASEHTPVIVIGLAAQLISAVDGSVVASRTFAIEQRSAGTGVAEVVAAFESGSSGLCAELAEWTLAQGDAAWGASIRR